jgi:hypothetical protein
MTTTAQTQAPHPLVQRSPLNERLTPDNFLEGDTVTMSFPKTVKLQLDDGDGNVTFFPGVQEVPVEYARHWWLRHNGVTVYDPKAAKKSAVADPAVENKLAKMTERELMFLQARGYQVSSIQDAQMFYENMDPIARPGFMASVDVWWQEYNKKASDKVPQPELEITKKNKK